MALSSGTRQRFREELHRRDPAGRFADKPDAQEAQEKAKRAGVTATDVIKLLESDAPKRGSAARRFALYRDGMTVQDYIDAVGDKRLALRDIAWDRKQGYIIIRDAAPRNFTRADFTAAGVNVATDAVIPVWNKTVGLSPQDVVTRLAAGLPGKARFGLNFPRDSYTGEILTDEVELDVYITDELRGDSKHNVLAATRVFREVNGQREVYHRSFAVDSFVRGQGLGKTFLRNSMSLYADMSVRKVTLNANIEVGSYAWARYGFKPTRAAWEKFRSDATVFHLQPDVQPQVRSLLSSDDPRAMWAIADIRTPHVSRYAREGQTTTVGQAMLMHNEWRGELRLDDEEAMRRFWAYVGKV